MEGNPLCLLLNKSHVFSPTKHIFTLIQLIALICQLHVSAVLRPPSGMSIQPLYDFSIDMLEDGQSTGRNI